MLSPENRQFMIENLQDSLRLVRHLMEFQVEDFARSLGVSCQTIKDLETKKLKMSPLQYIAIAALADNYFANHEDRLPKFKAIIDSDGKNYDAQYETSFSENSLLRRWFEDFISPENFPAVANLTEDLEGLPPELEKLMQLVDDYKIFLDAKTLLAEHVGYFVENLTDALKAAHKKIIIPLRSIEELKPEVSPNDFEKVIALIQEMRVNNVAQVFGEDSDPNFYLTIFAVFERLREKYRLCLITPDEYLAYRILILNEGEFIVDEMNQLGKLQEFVIQPAFLEGGEFRFYDTEILAEKFEGKTEPVHINPEYLRTGWFSFQYEDEEKEVPPEKNRTKTDKFRTWEEV